MTGAVTYQLYWIARRGTGLAGPFFGEVVKLLHHSDRVRAIQSYLAAARVGGPGDLVKPADSPEVWVAHLASYSACWPSPASVLGSALEALLQAV